MCLISASLLRRNVTAIQHVAAMNAGPASQRKLVGFSSRFEVRWSLVGAFAQMNAPFSSSFFLILFHPPFFLTLSFGGGVAISSGGKFFSFFLFKDRLQRFLYRGKKRVISNHHLVSLSLFLVSFYFLLFRFKTSGKAAMFRLWPTSSRPTIDVKTRLIISFSAPFTMNQKSSRYSSICYLFKCDAIHFDHNLFCSINETKPSSISGGVALNRWSSRPLNRETFVTMCVQFREKHFQGFLKFFFLCVFLFDGTKWKVEWPLETLGYPIALLFL